MNDVTTKSEIKCPNCATEINLSDAMSQSLREKFTAEFNAKLKTERERITANAQKSAQVKLDGRLKELESQTEEQQNNLNEARAN